MYSWIDRLRNMSLNKCLKSFVSEDLWTSEMANGPKHCWNLNYSNFLIFIDPSEENSVGKSLS